MRWVPRFRCTVFVLGGVFTKPPYWVDKADNCSVKPQIFGLRTGNGPSRYVIEDTSVFGKFFPDASKGDVVEMNVSAEKIVIIHGHKAVTLSTGAVKAEK